MKAITIIAVDELPAKQLAALVAESELEGWRFVRRLVEEWESATNRFQRAGEKLFVARVENQIIGVCGLNIDPYVTDETVGRVRRLYVSQECRGIGVGQRLVQTVMDAASGRFRRLRVRTSNMAASRLYERLGFLPVHDESDSTHLIEL